MLAKSLLLVLSESGECFGVFEFLKENPTNGQMNLSVFELIRSQEFRGGFVAEVVAREHADDLVVFQIGFRRVVASSCRHPDVSQISDFQHFVLVLIAELLEGVELRFHEIKLWNSLDYRKHGTTVAHKRYYLIPEILYRVSLRVRFLLRLR